MNRLRLKHPTGWFAADASFKRALVELSDGAFRLFALLCLEAQRPSGRLAFHQAELAQKLNKSRRSIGTYLKLLQQKGFCRFSSGPNQHAKGTLQISAHYWPYVTDSPHTTSSQETTYLNAVEQFYCSRPCVRFSFSHADRSLACTWFLQSIDLSLVEQAILFGCGRKYVSWLNGQMREPIGSLAYFLPILQDVLTQDLPPKYRAFNRFQVNRLEQRWLTRANPESARAKSAPPSPNK
jgi:hypothetical protein